MTAAGPVAGGGRLRELISRQDLERRVGELARQIDADFGGGGGGGGAAGATGDRGGGGSGGSGDPDGGGGRPAEDPVVCVGVLKGSVFFLADLLKRVTVPVAVDFFQTASYGGRGASRGEVRILKDVDLPLSGRDVLLIEDIVDTGYTLRTLLDLMRFRGARSVKLCALLDKAAAREVAVPIDYLGFTIEKLFVVGYGLDFNERFRNLPYIAVYDSGSGPLP